MLNVTQRAQDEVARFFKENPIKPIRVFLSNGCGGPQIALAIDDAKIEDDTFEFAGIQYLVDRTFLAQAQPIEIDFSNHGFKITSALALGCGCGSCGSSNDCCG
jgi:iron-sulfur cluster assembly protein